MPGVIAYGEDALADVDVGSLQADHERDLEMHLEGRKGSGG